MRFNHKTVYKRLHHIIIRAGKALEENVFEMLVRLGKEHEHIMHGLKQAGVSDDVDILGMLNEIKDQVDELVAQMKRKQDETGRELKKIGNGKKLAAAYGRF